MSNQSVASYLKWVKDTYPQVFATALRKVRQKNTLGGLGDDLVSDISVDPNSVTIDPSVSAAVDQSSTNSDTADAWSGFFSALSTAVSTVAPQVVQTQAQLSTIKTNQARAAAGLPAVGSNSLLTGVGLTGSSGLLILGLLGVGAVALMAGRRR